VRVNDRFSLEAERPGLIAGFGQAIGILDVRNTESSGWIPADLAVSTIISRASSASV